MKGNGKMVVDTVWERRHADDGYTVANGRAARKDDTVFDRVPHQQPNTKALGPVASKTATAPKHMPTEVSLFHLKSVSIGMSLSASFTSFSSDFNRVPLFTHNFQVQREFIDLSQPLSGCEKKENKKKIVLVVIWVMDFPLYFVCLPCFMCAIVLSVFLRLVRSSDVGGLSTSTCKAIRFPRNSKSR